MTPVTAPIRLLKDPIGVTGLDGNDKIAGRDFGRARSPFRRSSHRRKEEIGTMDVAAAFQMVLANAKGLVAPTVATVVLAFLEARGDKAREVRLAFFGFDTCVIGLGSLCELWVHAPTKVSAPVVLVTTVLCIVACIRASTLRGEVEDLEYGSDALRRAKEIVAAGGFTIAVALGVSFYVTQGVHS